MADRGYKADVVRLGIPDEYVHHGTQDELWAECGFDAEAIAAKVENMLLVKSTKSIVGQLS
jgi:1-deoxy-D-xylulose-5-phosphate synthase